MNTDPSTAPDFASFPVTRASRRKTANIFFMTICWITTAATLAVLVVLLAAIGWTAAPVFQSKPDVLESTVWSSIVQGDNEGNNPEAVDSGDYLQGVFVAEKLAVGGLSRENDEVYDNENSRVGIFSFELVQNLVDPRVFECRPASGRFNVTAILAAAGIEWDQLKDADGTPADAVIAILKSNTARWSIEDINSGDELVSGGKIASVFTSDDGWEGDLLIGLVRETDFCQLVMEQSLVVSETDTVGVEGIRRLRRKKKLGSITGLFEIIKHDPDIREIGPVKNNSPADGIVTGQIAIVPKNGFLAGLSRSKKQGFDFGGSLKLTSNFLPDQGSSMQHLSAFVSQTPKTNPIEAGIGPALSGTIWVCLGCALCALPLGIGTAICLEEFKPKNRFLAWVHNLVQLNITNLAGVPSIVYGIVGLTAFGTMFGLFGSAKEPMFEVGAEHYFQYISEGERILKIPAVRNDTGESKWVPDKLINGMEVMQADAWVKLNLVQPGAELPGDKELLGRTLIADAEGGLIVDKPWYYLQLPFGRGVLAASLTLMLVILPVIIIASQEALRAVPPTLRQGAFGLGSTRWQTVRNVTLPASIPSIMTGAILAMSRAIGEAAPIIVLAGIVYISAGPQNLMDTYSVLPVQIYYWAGLPIDDLAAVNWQNVASAGIVVLLAILLSFNAVAIAIRHWTHKPLS